MLLIGLTGSIATGKSTVSNILRAPPYSLPVIDADVMAREVVEPGTAGYAQIVSYFAASTPDLLLPAAGGARPLNRAALGRRVFGDSEERRRDRAALNAIVHPAVRARMYRLLLRYYVTGCQAVVLDVPLLFENGLDILCGSVLVVAVHEPALQMARLRARDPHLSADEARDRVRSQTDVRDKARRCVARGLGAGAVVWNDGDRDELRRGVDHAMVQIRRRSPRWWAWLLLLLPPLAGLAALWTYYRNTQFSRRWKADEAKASRPATPSETRNETSGRSAEY
jgi:dephospho-CoA kinase